MTDRVDTNADGTVDDVALDAVMVRIEDLGDRIWVAAYRADGDRFAFEVFANAGRAECRMVEGSVGSLAGNEPPAP